MIMNIVMAATLYPTMLIMVLLLLFAAKDRNGMTFGVHLTQEQLADPVVSEIREKYKKENIAIVLAIFLLPILFFFTTHVSIQFTLWISWFLIALFAVNIPFMRANHAAMALKGTRFAYHLTPVKKGSEKKSEKEIEHEQEKETESTTPLYIETSIVRTVRFLDFLPTILISILFAVLVLLTGKFFHLDTITMDRSKIYHIMVLSIAPISVLIYPAAKWMDAMRSVIISTDSAVNTSYNRAKKQIWRKFWLGEAWLNTAFTAFIFLCESLFLLKKDSMKLSSTSLFVLLSILDCVLALVILIVTGKNLKTIDAKYQPQKAIDFNLDDEDQYWLFGMFYFNPRDKRAMVPKRFGIGTTSNMATKSGKAALIVAVGSLIWIPAMCVWLILQDFTPMHITCTDGIVSCTHLNVCYELPVSSMQDLQLLHELPENREKFIGTGTDEIEKGEFTCEAYGSYESFVRCENRAFIYFKSFGTSYIISGWDDQETQDVYAQILALQGGAQ